MAKYTILSNRTTNHIDGLAVRTQGGGNDTGDHISYAAESACGALTRNGDRMARGAASDNLAAILRSAEASARKLCKSCEAAARAVLAAEHS